MGKAFGRRSTVFNGAQYVLPFYFVVGSCGVLIAIGFFQLHWLHIYYNAQLHHVATSWYDAGACEVVKHVDDKPKYIVYAHDPDSGYLKHVYEMFEYFGFERGDLESDDWHVLWAHEYPFRKLPKKFKSLAKHQKVNHFPGTGYITNKLDLATSKSKYIPTSFQIPQQKEELLNYISAHPEKMFVQKSNDHRGVRIQNTSLLDLTRDDSFIQEYIDKPLLVDGHKFDIGVYTVITSVQPLRVYIYNGDILFRFCPREYYPLDANDTDKYVIGDDYLPIWEMKSLKKYFTRGGYSMRDSFNQYMRQKGRDVSIMWERIEDAIREISLSKEGNIIRLLQTYESKDNFFEMVRFDFTVDEDLQVFVMEANMSPNLSSAHYPPNRLLYLQVLFNLFSLVGLGEYTKKYDKSYGDVAMKDVAVNADVCGSDVCDDCSSSECDLCVPCMTEDTVSLLKKTYREYRNRQDCKRIFPPTIKNPTNVSSLNWNNVNAQNGLLYRWFYLKCSQDYSWC